MLSERDKTAPRLSEIADSSALVTDGPAPVVIAPGEGHRVGNVEFLARTVDTPRFNFGIIEIPPGRVLEAHVHESRTTPSTSSRAR